MANLKSLIRLHRYEVDEKRRALGLELDALYKILDAKTTLERQYALEREALEQSGDIAFTLGGYVKQYKDRQEQFARDIDLAEKRIEIAKDILLDSFAELKKFEMTQAERERLEAEERRIKEAKTFDDIGLEIFRRREE